MDDVTRGFPKRCRCGKVAQMKTSSTMKNPGRLFFTCPNAKEGDWSHLFKWTDLCVVEEIDEVKERIVYIEEFESTIDKSIRVCEDETANLKFETNMRLDLLEKEVGECKTELRCLKNLIGFGLLMALIIKLVI